MDSRYDHLQHENSVVTLWEQAGVVGPTKSANNKAKSFSIIMPPPNANDPLHLGHALGIAIEDILIRYHRMLGEPTLWLPGTDHAGIETQYVYEKKLAKLGKSRFEFSRKDLYQNIRQYVEENSGIAIKQMKRLGASADWSKYKFTLDQDVVTFVTQTFIKMHQDGLIYRDLRLVNYCTKCGTSYSDLELKHVKQITQLYYIKYGPFVLATTRPETKFADTAVAVHPKDKRYQKYIGQNIEVDGLLGKFELTVIADEFVDQNFGTGVVKITPYHDFDDYAVWLRHKHDMPEPKQVVDFTGKLTEIAGPYSGMKIQAARTKIVEDLNTKGLLVKTDTAYSNSVGVCYRCDRPLEPLPLPQFFVKVNDQRNSLTQKATALLDQKKIKIHGAGKEKILRHWLKNLRDWNISRQIVWGIAIPVWYQISGFEQQTTVRFIDKNGEIHQGKLDQLLNSYSLPEIEQGLQTLSASPDTPYLVGVDKPSNKELYLPETDTLDTWFSSAQWPVVTLKTNSHEDFEQFYPTSVMETAYDILPFWVMRMMLLGEYLTNQQPFDQVYFHGLIRDNKGQKMSKSKGNVLNPITIADQYSADALRLALVIRSTAGQDKSVGVAELTAARNFTNKIWNASRYVLMHFDDVSSINKAATADAPPPTPLKYQRKLDSIITTTTKQLNLMRIGQAADKVVYSFKHWYCDEIIELHKQGKIDDQFLLSSLLIFLKLLHPFIPFVTESIWQEAFNKKLVQHNLLITSLWPNLS